MQPLIFPIFLDYKCNYQCGHCSVGSSPRTRFPVDEELVFPYLRQIAELPTAARVWSSPAVSRRCGRTCCCAPSPMPTNATS